MSLPLFDEWYAQHQESCGRSRLDVRLECLVEGETEIQIRCRMCGDSITGTAAAELFDIAARLAPGLNVKAG